MARKVIRGRTKGARRRLNAMLSKKQQKGVKAITRAVLRGTTDCVQISLSRSGTYSY